MSRSALGRLMLLGLVAMFPSIPSEAEPASAPFAAARVSLDHGAIVRGPRDRRRLALIFTGGSFGEGTAWILQELAARRMKAAMFVTGDFLRNPEHTRLLKGMIAEGHYLGPHSDAHLLYCPWEQRDRTLVTKAQFCRDLERNLGDLAALGMPREQMRYFVPPYEWYNDEIVRWAAEMNLVTVSFTPGTRANADYLPDGDPRFVSGEQIIRGILEYEAREPEGLRGFLLLTHLGVGPERTDKLYRRLGPLLDELLARGSEIVPLDALLGSSASQPSPAVCRGISTRPAAGSH